MSDTSPARSRRTLYTVLGIVGALLVVVVVLLVVIVTQNNAAANQHEHEGHIAICEQGLSDPYGKDLDEFTACLEKLEP